MEEKKAEKMKKNNVRQTDEFEANVEKTESIYRSNSEHYKREKHRMTIVNGYTFFWGVFK